MGADIHMYVEHRDKKRVKKDIMVGVPTYWNSYGDEINPGRNYTMFGILAEVRGSYKDSFSAKGMVNDMGYAAKHDAYMFIVNKPKEEVHENGCVSKEDASRYASYGKKIINDTWIEHPDWHSHSWMTIKELKKAFKIYKKHASKEWDDPNLKAPLEYRALLASMQELEDGGKNEVRVVFWFDN